MRALILTFSVALRVPIAHVGGQPCRFVLRKRIVLGRASRRWRQLFSHAGLAPEDFVGMRAGVVDIHLSDDPAIARRHAVVMWNEQHRAFFIRRLSEERSIFIDGIELPYDSAGLGCPLRSGALVQIGHCCFVFTVAAFFFVVGGHDICRKNPS